MRKNCRCSVNEIGRIVIPAKIRKQLGLQSDTPVEIYSKDGHVHIRKYQESCVFCKSAHSLTAFKEQPICQECLLQFGSRRAAVGIG